MKSTNHLIAAAIFILLSFIPLIAKQPPSDLGYEPPKGWEFVMKLDSASTFYIHCHNDSCFLCVQLYTKPAKLIYDITTDGGETWNKIPYMPVSHILFKINSMTLHDVIGGGSNCYYQISNDFYKTSEKYSMGDRSYAFDQLYCNPIDPNILIATFLIKEFVDELYIRSNMYAMISHDGGKNWEMMNNLYKQPKFLHYTNSILIGLKKGIGLFQLKTVQGYLFYLLNTLRLLMTVKLSGK